MTLNLDEEDLGVNYDHIIVTEDQYYECMRQLEEEWEPGLVTVLEEGLSPSPINTFYRGELVGQILLPHEDIMVEEDWPEGTLFTLDEGFYERSISAYH